MARLLNRRERDLISAAMVEVARANATLGKALASGDSAHLALGITELQAVTRACQRTLSNYNRSRGHCIGCEGLQHREDCPQWVLPY